ncbi:MAG: DUF1287 domain-containing protein [Proteobacteria bacterium]|nr:MAG: DUF1287 domain-containing protein [Pseudomonadota bacterium]
MRLPSGALLLSAHLLSGLFNTASANPYLAQALVAAADERTRHSVTYDGSYQKIGFPWGDVADNIGVCSDVVIRAYRKLGIDLQHLVNHDMTRNFYAYPSYSHWKLTQPDPNIDHRRVLNLQVFFSRAGQNLPITYQTQDYRPGDIVTWDIRPGMPHIGIVSDKLATDGLTPLIIHNIGKGPTYENSLFSMKITGHFRYYPTTNHHYSVNG